MTAWRLEERMDVPAVDARPVGSHHLKGLPEPVELLQCVPTEHPEGSPT